MGLEPQLTAWHPRFARLQNLALSAGNHDPNPQDPWPSANANHRTFDSDHPRMARLDRIHPGTSVNSATPPNLDRIQIVAEHTLGRRCRCLGRTPTGFHTTVPAVGVWSPGPAMSCGTLSEVTIQDDQDLGMIGKDPIVKMEAGGAGRAQVADQSVQRPDQGRD